MRWVEALKIWNAEHNPGKWCVARKGTEGYDQVKAIMARDKPAAAPEKKGFSKTEIMERIKAKRAEKRAKAEAPKKAADESDALIAEIDAFLKTEAKPAPSAPKAPSRNLAAEMAYIHQLASEHAERYRKEHEKAKAVAEAAKKRMATPRSSAPSRAPRRPESEPSPAPSRGRSSAPLKGREAKAESGLEKAAREALHAVDVGRPTYDKHDFLNNFAYFSKMSMADIKRLFASLPFDFTKADLARALA